VQLRRESICCSGVNSKIRSALDRSAEGGEGNHGDKGWASILQSIWWTKTTKLNKFGFLESLTELILSIYYIIKTTNIEWLRFDYANEEN
jgi:hypothetical protein